MLAGQEALILTKSKRHAVQDPLGKLLAHLVTKNFETMTKVFGVDPYIINNKFIEIFSASKLGHL